MSREADRDAAMGDSERARAMRRKKAQRLMFDLIAFGAEREMIGAQDPGTMDIFYATQKQRRAQFLKRLLEL